MPDLPIADVPNKAGATPEERQRVQQQFKVPFDQHSSRWDGLWAKGDNLPFDRGLPNDALVDTLDDRQDLVGRPLTTNGQRRRALVPGCGRGYDVLLLASLGYEAYGLEVSQSAVDAANEFATKSFADYVSRSASGAGAQGSYSFLHGDFFSDQWVGGTSAKDHGFDLIYDYTFLCALSPEMRPAWAKRTYELLAHAPESRLICVEFPCQKPPAAGGPPFGVSPSVYALHLALPGQSIPYNDDGYPKEEDDLDGESSPNAAKNSSPLIRLDHWQPKRSHHAGKGEDWVSVWRRR